MSQLVLTRVIDMRAVYGVAERNSMIRIGFAVSMTACLALPAIASSPVQPSPQTQTQTDAPTTAPESVFEQALRAYTVRRGLKQRQQAAAFERQRRADLPPGIMAAAPIIGTAVAGEVRVPILTFKYADTEETPYGVDELQRELFGRPYTEGTMTAHFDEMSYGRLTVTGTVYDWLALPQNEAEYTGPVGCLGIRCSPLPRLENLLNSVLSKADDSVDFTIYDNDGPDGRPNSGDDDGVVDFVGLVHASKGGECLGATTQMQSHRYGIELISGARYVTNDIGTSGLPLEIDDYVMMPGLSCDGDIIEIGVFSHEVSHAFGLPDLYDTKGIPTNAGIGIWGLMAYGLWGGNMEARTPDVPVHLSAWSKEFLGWVTPQVVSTDTKRVSLRPFALTGNVVRVDYAPEFDPADERYLLITYRTREGFDRSLPGNGLIVTEVNNAIVAGGIRNNTVNGNSSQLGVNVIEADGLRELDRNDNKGEAGDQFPGSRSVENLDSGSDEPIQAAICDISIADDSVTFDLYVTRTTCPDRTGLAAVSIEEALSAPAGTEIVIDGFLTNRGENYFTDRDLAIMSGDMVLGPIISSAPIGIVPPPPGTLGAPDVGVVDPLSANLDMPGYVRGAWEIVPQTDGALQRVFRVEEFVARDP